MRKIATLLCFTLLVLPLMFGNVYATASESEIYDSVNIPEDELLAVKDFESDVVIKVYTGSFMYGISERATIHELIKPHHTIYERYFVYPDGRTFSPYSKYYKDGELRRGTVGAYVSWHEETIYKCAFSYEELFSSYYLTKSLQDLSVSEIYVLDGATNIDALYVYYVTNYGDYVYYCTWNTPKDGYLIPLEDLYALVFDKYQNRSTEPGTGGGGGVDITDIPNNEHAPEISEQTNNDTSNVDPENTDVGNIDLGNTDTQDAPKKFNPLWIIAPVIILTVSVIFVFCKKRKIF